MNIIVFLVSVVLLFFSIILFRNKPLSPMVLFYGLWSFILFLSMLNLYGIYKPGEEAYFLIMLMLIFFFVGSFIVYFLKISLGKKIRLPRKKDKTTVKMKSVIFYFLAGCCIFFTLIDCMVVVAGLLNDTPLWVMRGWRMAPYGSSNPMLDRRSFLEEVFRSVILDPFGTLFAPIAAYYFFDPQKQKKRYIMLAISISYLLLSSFAGGGGRLGYIYYFGCFLLAYLTMSNRKLFPKFRKGKYRKYIIFILVFGTSAVVLFTRFRTGAGNFVKQTYTYFALPPTLLGVWLKELGDVSHTNGFLTFFGVHSYLFRFLEAIGLNDLVPELYHVAFEHMLNSEKFRDVGYSVASAFVTPVYHFYIDGGYPFVCLFSMFFGGVVAKYYRRFISKAYIDIRSFVFYALIMYGVFLSFIRIQTSIPSYIISFLMAYFILEKDKDYESENT